VSSESFIPTLRDDGTFDPDCLERAGVRWVTGWLKGRLSGRDPYFPIDRRGEEDPEALIVSILRDAGTAHPATDLIARALLALLDEARSGAPEIPLYLGPALQICQQVRLPQASSWFTEELKKLADDLEATEARWGEDVVREILYAASLQAPGLPQSASHESWRVLLKIPRYTTLAWVGLGPTFAQSVTYIEDWWRVCPPEEREAEIDHLVFMGLETEGQEAVHLIRLTSTLWPDELRSAVDEAFKKCGVTDVFAPPAMSAGEFARSLRSLFELEDRLKGEPGKEPLKPETDESEELRRLQWENQRLLEEREKIRQRVIAAAGSR
jgi:hypothetical protein